MNSHLVPWKTLTSSKGTPYLYSLNSPSFVLTDLKKIYSYEFPSDILAKNEEFNPSLEFSEESDVLEEINRILESKNSNKILQGTTFVVEDNDDEVPFGWTFECTENIPGLFYEQITKHLLRGVHRLWEERSALIKIIKSKDAELEALYTEDGASLTRKSIKTKKFNPESLLPSEDFRPFELLTSESYFDFLKGTSKSKPLPSYRSVEKRLKMTTNNLFDENDEDEDTSSTLSTPTSSPRKNPKASENIVSKKNDLMKKKLKKL